MDPNFHMGPFVLTKFKKGICQFVAKQGPTETEVCHLKYRRYGNVLPGQGYRTVVDAQEAVAEY